MIRIIKEYFYPLCVMAVVLIAVGLTAFLPIYPDEFAYKIFLERFFINGGFKQSASPFCPEGFLVKPNLLLIPAAAFWSIISWLGSDWESYRIIPFLGLLIIYSTLILHNVRKGERTFWPLLLFMTMGPSLYGIVLLRPEILILSVCMMLYVLARLMLSTQKEVSLYFYVSLLLLLFSLIAYVHPKALYLLPVVVVPVIMMSFNFRHKLHGAFYAMFFITMALLISYTAVDMHSVQFLSCDAITKIAQLMNKQAVNPLELFEAPGKFFESMKLALSGNAFELSFERMLFYKSYPVSYLPAKQNINFLAILANVFIVAIVIQFIVYIVWKSIICWRFLKGAEERKQFYLVVSVIVSLFIPFILNITKHFYEVSFFFCSLMIIAALLWPFKVEVPRPSGQGFNRCKSRLNTLFFMYMMTVSILCVGLQYHDFTREFIAGYQGPSQSVAINRKLFGEKIRQALLKASILETEPIMMDDLTYDAVREHPIVIPVTYLKMVSGVPGAMSFYLKKFHVRYGVMNCLAFNNLKTLIPIEKISTISYRHSSSILQANGEVTEITEACLFGIN
jgi:hypothetical protein